MSNPYESLESFSDFADFSDPKHYVRLPPGWSILVADIVGSAQAIEAGRYQDLNTIGGACIAAVRNVLEADFPSVFGGDGAAMAVPEEHRLDSLFALLGVRRMVEDQFNNLELNVGSLTIHDIEQQAPGVYVEVGRYELAAGRCIALFRGGGLAYARNALRKQESLHSAQSNRPRRPSLQGLNNRWGAIPNRNGCIMSLLVCENPFIPGNVYSEVMREINSILRNDRASANPVNIEMARFKGVRELLREESRFHSRRCSAGFMLRAIEITMSAFAFRLGFLKGGKSGVQSFKKAIRRHSDHLKFDDMLRMVIDCTKDQGNAIESMLQDKHSHGRKLCYGIFYSTHTLMTSLVQDMNEGNHIHFIDGDNGGYVMAAKQLREQMSALEADTKHHAELKDLSFLEDASSDDDIEAPSLNFGRAPSSEEDELVECYQMFIPGISSSEMYSTAIVTVAQEEGFASGTEDDGVDSHCATQDGPRDTVTTEVGKKQWEDASSYSEEVSQHHLVSSSQKGSASSESMKKKLKKKHSKKKSKSKKKKKKHMLEEVNKETENHFDDSGRFAGYAEHLYSSISRGGNEVPTKEVIARSA